MKSDNRISVQPAGGSADNSGPEEKAQKLFVETSHLVSLAQEAEQTSYGEALMLYRRALAKAEEITTRYATSPLADKLRAGEAKTGPYTLTELRDVVVPRVEVKAQAESDPLACALLIANTIPNSTSRASVVADIAVAYDEAGRYDQIWCSPRCCRSPTQVKRFTQKRIDERLSPRC